jgi:two-component system repressor protein LuxO
MISRTDHVLVIEDTMSIAMVFRSWLGRKDIQTEFASTGAEGLEKIRSGLYRAVLLDLQLPDTNGIEILKQVQRENLDVAIVVVTASGSISNAVEAMRLGAYDFIVKPASEERLVTTMRNALERTSLRRAVSEIRKGYEETGTHGFIGASLPMIAVYKTIDAVSRSNASVFILGESGTGKEVCATAIHNASGRSHGRFVALNCAAIPKDLMESEIFGHIKGAFTGATGDREGAAIAADGGTLFLDEICEMDINLQSKLLRFLQTGCVQKVGSDRVTKVDVRIVCATNRNPLREVQEGRFREDLYYRLFVVPVQMPPLREREGDVLLIAEQFLAAMAAEEGKHFEGFSADAEGALTSYSWPGNVRELQNVIRKAVILNDGPFIDGPMLAIGGDLRAVIARAAVAANQDLPVERTGAMTIDLSQPFHVIERQIIEEAIRRSGDSILKASQVLEISPSTIYRKKDGWEAA